MNDTLSFEHVCKSFAGRGKVLRDVSFEVPSDRLTVLIGPNGSGKSTLLGIAAGTCKPDTGRVVLKDGEAISETQRVGVVWQDYRSSLLPWLSVEENVAFPVTLKASRRANAKEIARSLLEEHLPDVNPDGPVYRLSGGQQQMLCLFRMYLMNPQFILLDEPFSALDQERRLRYTHFVEEIWTRLRKPTVCISHDVDEAVLLADQIVLLTEEGTIANVIHVNLSRPRTTAQLSSEEHLRCRDIVFRHLLQEQGHQAKRNAHFLGNCG